MSAEISHCFTGMKFDKVFHVKISHNRPFIFVQCYHMTSVVPFILLFMTSGSQRTELRFDLGLVPYILQIESLFTAINV